MTTISGMQLNCSWTSPTFSELLRQNVVLVMEFFSDTSLYFLPTRDRGTTEREEIKMIKSFDRYCADEFNACVHLFYHYIYD
ncbi:hypothetical protein ANCCAN_29772 [Ancylostoma caninum]|uniref:Uncharacterized protein n=1 Tax=Ancylostoma caninum TaxID=29170 RepID=A0A368F0K5_ANCCA|nr:hypothetical protein ANCCAN_29772 [Ancylostoma caninum]